MVHQNLTFAPDHIKKLRKQFRDADRELESLGKTLKSLRHKFGRVANNLYARDKLIRAYCGSEASTSYSETDRLIDQLGELRDLIPLSNAIEKALNDKASSLQKFPEGRPSVACERKFAEDILDIIRNGADSAITPQKIKGEIDTEVPTPLRHLLCKKQISHAKRCQLASGLLEIVGVNLSPKRLQNIVPGN